MLGRWMAVLSVPLWLAACSSAPTVSVVEAPPADPVTGAPGQMEFTLSSGRYHCDMGQTVDVFRHTDDRNRINVGWHGELVELARNPSASGLPRYESAASGLVWIDLPWKSVLLDDRKGKPLASDCKPA
ncbi:MliC family protein [Denitromonas sp.]|uniref:MliC family protein n=1 Tax=Denitromonas sp. TaxID=2734609 RepID=UPI002B000EAB|nr:MliC family protein [Denitromonas sp.]